MSAEEPFNSPESLLRRAHGLLEANPLRSPEEFLTLETMLRGAKLPMDTLAQKVIEWTGQMSYAPSESEWDTLTKSIMTFIEEQLRSRESRN